MRHLAASLIDHKPANRPTARELLNMLPPEFVPDHGMRAALEALATPQSTGFIRLMGALFSHDRSAELQQKLMRERIKHQQQGPEETFQLQISDLAMQNQIIEQITQSDFLLFPFLIFFSVFKRHGALHTRVPWMESSISEAWASLTEIGDNADVLLSDGTIMTLPYDLRLGFAKQLAAANGFGGPARLLRLYFSHLTYLVIVLHLSHLHFYLIHLLDEDGQVPDSFKRYTIGPIYRKPKSDQFHSTRLIGEPSSLRI